ncbi:phosphoribosylglycinamide formyltransferase-1 [Micrococcus terreus]|uniref:Phosphoribosylglycinamide formyltransferase n=1 Tax=Micrococcus terreus TaxID=574650 RepID=A0A1I7MMN7_9MICC|nr:phosphoribosylglycinamide formyltransferase-1 [Micrococcus terreus]
MALVSGSGTNLQAVIDAVAAGQLNVEIAAVGADRPDAGGLDRAARAGIETFVVDFAEFSDRSAWNQALTERCSSYAPDYVLSSGFMRIVGEAFLAEFGGRYLNTHPALLPAFPGAHGVRDALRYGVKIAGCTVHIADAGVDTGPILAQAAVPVVDGDTEETLHERIKVQERHLLLTVLGELAGGKRPEDYFSGTATAQS